MSVSTPTGLADAIPAVTHADLLSHTIEHEIIPRLMLAHRSQSHAPSGELLFAAVDPDNEAAAIELATRAVLPFTRVLLESDQDTANLFVEALRQRGVPLNVLYLQLLAPSARRLGELWDQDLCNFTDVTVAAGRLQQLLRELSQHCNHRAQRTSEGRRLLLLPAPREQHTLGLLMVAEFFCRGGWEVSGGPLETGYDPVKAVARDWFDVVGFSLAATMHLEALTQSVVAVRRASRNPNVVIMLGGPAVMNHPDLVAPVGADLLVCDASKAPELAVQFLATRRHVN